MNELDKQSKLNQGKNIAEIIENAFSGIQSAIEEIGDIESVENFETEDSDLIAKKNLLLMIRENMKGNK